MKQSEYAANIQLTLVDNKPAETWMIPALGRGRVARIDWFSRNFLLLYACTTTLAWFCVMIWIVWGV